MPIFRVHPAIGIARVGNSEDIVISPESRAGCPNPGAPGEMGGLPIRFGTEITSIRSSDLRDASGALKRHAARFRIFAYDETKPERYPRGDGTEVTIGSTIGGRIVSDIVWTVHLANKKANAFVLSEGKTQGINEYENGGWPALRNPDIADGNAGQPSDAAKLSVVNEPGRVRRLTIDPGPRVIRGGGTARLLFDRTTPASWYDPIAKIVKTAAAYPKSFPADLTLPDGSAPTFDIPSGPIECLGDLRTEPSGRLIVAGGLGRAVGWKLDGKAPLDNDTDNNQWFDDTADGPVTATLVFEDGHTAEAQGAWVTVTDPSYAPQILNMVSAWDDVYDCWVRDLALQPDLYADGDYRPDYKPAFDDDIAPIFQSAAQQQWVVNLNPLAQGSHAALARITATTDPASTPLAGLAIFRNPFLPAGDPQHDNDALMPLALGDGYEPFLSLRKTQYFLLQRWNAGLQAFQPSSPNPPGPGEYLDKATLVNCLGGRFSPGIDVTFVIREPKIYLQPWSDLGTGPFRVRARPLDYMAADGSAVPLLTGGYIPRHAEDAGLEPGDFSKFMALPWHTDYNSCATHTLLPNNLDSRKLFWSWPAQRPVAVYNFEDVAFVDPDPGADWKPGGPEQSGGSWQLIKQRWSVRGYGTDSGDAEHWARYLHPIDMVDNWHRVGTVLQATAIDGGASLPGGWFLETESRLRDTDLTPVEPFPNYASRMDEVSADQLSSRQLFNRLLNAGESPDVATDAFAYADYWLANAQKLSGDHINCPVDLRAFAYSEDALGQRLDEIYQSLVDAADASDPANPDNPVNSREKLLERIRQLAPFNLVDGAWLRNIAQPGPADDISALLFSIWQDELGNGIPSMNHCNIYSDLCHSVGFYPHPIESREFAYDPIFLDSAFDVPAFELAVSLDTQRYVPEILGMTLQLEWEVIDLKPIRDTVAYFGVSPAFYDMHIGIDNAVNGHGQRAREAVQLYLDGVRKAGGEQAVQAAFLRVWNGYVAFSSVGTLGTDFLKLINKKPDLHDQMIEVIQHKAAFGSRNHGTKMLGGSRINDWFADPPAFLDQLSKCGWLTPGDWENSRLRELVQPVTGRMFRVFTDEEIALWRDYTNALGSPPSAKPQPAKPPAMAMAELIDALRDAQQNAMGHQDNMLMDAGGVAHTVSWWFQQPTRSFMAALALPANTMFVPGDPEAGGRLLALVQPEGPMGGVFSAPAPGSDGGTGSEIVYRWIKASSPLPTAENFRLRLNTSAARRAKHPTGEIVGMGTVH